MQAVCLYYLHVGHWRAHTTSFSPKVGPTALLLRMIIPLVKSDRVGRGHSSCTGAMRMHDERKSGEVLAVTDEDDGQGEHWPRNSNTCQCSEATFKALEHTPDIWARGTASSFGQVAAGHVCWPQQVIHWAREHLRMLATAWLGLPDLAHVPSMIALMRRRCGALLGPGWG